MDKIQYILKQNNEYSEYRFNGDLTLYLINNLINEEHINKMKKKILIKDYFEEYYDVDKKNERVCMDIETDRIFCGSRFSINKSVYDNVNIIQQGEREPSRFIKCFSYLERLGIKKYYDSLVNNIDPISVNYYCEDNIYSVTSDGNHRALVAMITGAKFIKAMVTVYRRNESLFCMYNKIKDFYKTYRIIDLKKSLYSKVFLLTFLNDNKTFYNVKYLLENNEPLCILNELENKILEDNEFIKKYNNKNFIFKFVDRMMHGKKRYFGHVFKRCEFSLYGYHDYDLFAEYKKCIKQQNTRKQQ